MLYTYHFADGENAPVEVSEELMEVLKKEDLAEAASDKKQTRRSCSLDARLYEGMDFAAPGDALTPLLEKEAEKESSARIRAVLDTMTETQRRRFLLCMQGRTQREIAELEGVAQPAVWLTLEECREKFKNFFEGTLIKTRFFCPYSEGAEIPPLSETERRITP